MAELMATSTDNASVAPAVDASSQASTNTTSDNAAAQTVANKIKDTKRTEDKEGKVRKEKKSKKHRHNLKKSSKSTNVLTDSEESDSDSPVQKTHRSKKSKNFKRNRKSRKDNSLSNPSDSLSSSSDDDEEPVSKQLAELSKQVAALTTALSLKKGSKDDSSTESTAEVATAKEGAGSTNQRTAGGPAPKLGFKRVDHVWDKDNYKYKIIPSVEETNGDASALFNVRRDFDYFGHPTGTIVEIHSKHLKEILKDVLKEMTDVSMDSKLPTLNPKVLFHHYEEICEYAKSLKRRVKIQRKTKERKRSKEQRKHCNVLLGYVDEDYKEDKKQLKPLLKKGLITFDLMWALYKPTSLCWTAYAEVPEQVQCLKVQRSFQWESAVRGELYCVQGISVDYDGKTFGIRFWDVDVEKFTGTKKINTLEAYPIEYHANTEASKQALVERGKKFVGLQGMHHKFLQGIGFKQLPRQVQNVSINSRVMDDRATFRRINPNYPFSYVKAADVNLHSTEYVSEEDSDKGSDSGNCDSEDECGTCGEKRKTSHKHKRIYPFYRDRSTGEWKTTSFLVDDPGEPCMIDPRMKPIEGKSDFLDEQLILPPPVVYGFAFQEKLWCEFSIEGISDIEWNAGAFDSLVVPDDRKDIIKAVVESHKHHAIQTIDDVGFVCILHGPPGVGKTLTAEGIAELLKCPLDMVTSGELGTRSDNLEKTLQQILDVAHTWGAVLLLDEADIFLEQRQAQDVSRNAMVSVFLRVLEYFRCILFLTTNQVQCFDEAFDSRIHLALKYGPLSYEAKRSVWKIFLDRCATDPRAAEDKSTAKPLKAATDSESPTKLAATPSDSASSGEPTPAITGSTTSPAGVLVLSLTEKDYDYLASRQVNGRQIKNAVKMAQALAVNEGKPLGMQQIKKVLGVQESFTADWKGGDSYLDAIRRMSRGGTAGAKAAAYD